MIFYKKESVVQYSLAVTFFVSAEEDYPFIVN